MTKKIFTINFSLNSGEGEVIRAEHMNEFNVFLVSNSDVGFKKQAGIRKN